MISGTIGVHRGTSKESMIKTANLKKIAIAAGYGLLTYILVLSVAWFGLAQVDFLYGFWHDNVGIKEGIEQYGPQNRYRPGFAETTREQRVELFAAINDAVHSRGRGLEQITYQTPTSGGEQTLLRTPEIVHLKDVAVLLDKLFFLVVAVFIGWPLATFFLYKHPAGLPTMKNQLLGIVIFIALVLVTLFIFGAENVFNQLHIWIFPGEHQWFFYYQDSLMSTMMLAPRLFGWIAVVLAALSLLLFIVVQFLLAKISRHEHKPAPGAYQKS